jgi:hypothetical protein
MRDVRDRFFGRPAPASWRQSLHPTWDGESRERFPSLLSPFVTSILSGNFRLGKQLPVAFCRTVLQPAGASPRSSAPRTRAVHLPPRIVTDTALVQLGRDLPEASCWIGHFGNHRRCLALARRAVGVMRERWGLGRCRCWACRRCLLRRSGRATEQHAAHTHCGPLATAHGADTALMQLGCDLPEAHAGLAQLGHHGPDAPSAACRPA